MQSIEALKNQIINADFHDVLKELPDKCFDLLLTDPPYGIDIIGQRIKTLTDVMVIRNLSIRHGTKPVRRWKISAK